MGVAASGKWSLMALPEDWAPLIPFMCGANQAMPRLFPTAYYNPDRETVGPFTIQQEARREVVQPHLI